MMNVYVIPGFGTRGSELGKSEARVPSPKPLYLLDLPGYGYSRASHTDRRTFRLLISHVLKRPLLAGVLWLLDIRHEPSADDRAMHGVFAEGGIRVLAALTKTDKLSRTDERRREGELRDALSLDDDQMIATSARANEGIEDLRQAIGELVGKTHTA